MSAFRSQLGKGYLHGGGDTVTAGANITITTDNQGRKVISSTGGGGVPSDTVVDETAYGQVSTPGISTDYSRGDHTHGTPDLPTKGDIGLGNVDNTSDLNKPISTATQSALDLKVDESITLTINGVTYDLSANRSWTVSGGASLTEVEFDMGSTPIPTNSFTITDASVTPSSKIVVFPSPNPATGRVGNDFEFDSATFSALTGTGSFTLYVNSPYKMVGKRNVYYQIV